MSKLRIDTHLVPTRNRPLGAATCATVVALVFGCSSSSEDPNPGTGNAGSTATGGSGGGGGSPTGGSSGSSGVAGATPNGGQAGAAAGGSAGAGGTAGGAGGAGGSAGGAAGAAGGGAGGAAAGASGGGAGGAAGGGAGAGGTAAFELTSTAFMEGDVVPLQYKCAQPNNNPAGMNQSPPLSWGPGPEGTLSYAVAMRHIAVPYHWVIWDIPAVAGMGVSLPEDIDHDFEPADVQGAKQSYLNGLDEFTGFGYLGPCPQATNSEQEYEFSLYALDVATLPGLTGMVTPDQALAAVEDNMVEGSEPMLLTGKQTRVP